MTPIKNTKTLPLAITMGDPAGIGPEIIIKACSDANLKLEQAAIVYADAEVLQAELERFSSINPGNQKPLKLQRIHNADSWHPQSGILQFIAVSRLPSPIKYGVIQADYGRAAANAIERATHDTLAGLTSAVVTAPIHKEALAAAGVQFPGHTEMLAALAGHPPVRMMLANQELRAVLVTIHLSMRAAIDAISFQSVLETLRITHRALQHNGIANPRLAVAGLNPHAGEGGLFGQEEIQHIQPAIAQANAEGINAQGPFPSDTIFSKARHFKQFDAVIAMYHDQGLIPVKYLGIEEGVNVTLGLPFIRTSVDHGTAFDIAGKGIADHRSLIAAIRMAQTMLSH